MRRTADVEKIRKRKIIRAVIIEIIFLIMDVLCCLLPLPWRLLVPIIVGSRAIIVQAVRKSREQPQVVHCHGELPLNTTAKQKPKRRKENAKSKKK